MDEESYDNSIKADLVPIINAELQMDEDRLYSLSIAALTELFGVVQTKTISVAKLREIIAANSSSETIIDALKKAGQTPSPSGVPLASSESPPAGSETIFSQDSIKADIVPVIQNTINVNSEKLYALSINVLNEIFNYLESGVIPAKEIESIILASQDSEEIATKLQKKLSETIPSTDTYKEDLITGILFNFPENIRAQIEPKLREIQNTDELVELSQLDLPQIQSKMGIETVGGPVPQTYDEKLDLIAGIIAQLPPSLQGIIGDRLQEIQNMDQLVRLSQMNYVQVQQELGLAPQSPSSIPAEISNPVDTAIRPSRSETQSAPSSPPSAQSSTVDSSPASPPEAARMLSSQESALGQVQMQQRWEENKKYIPTIQKMAEKIWKIKLSEGAAQTPEAVTVKEKIEIIQRIHPERVEKILDRLKNAKDKKRFIALFDWYVYSHRIEEIETHVEHWQGQIQGSGAFRAAINVSRFDPIVEHLPTKEIEGINLQAKSALERIHSSDIQVRARGVEDIKQISNYLLQKTR